MNSRTGIPICISLTYSVFDSSLLGKDEMLNVYRFNDNLYPGLLKKSKGESEECRFTIIDLRLLIDDFRLPSGANQ
jgi:hypothetical protein